MRAKAGNLSGTAYSRVLSQPRSLQRTPEWVEPADGKDKKPRPNQILQTEADLLATPFFTLHVGP